MPESGSPKIDTMVPHVARVWDYFHGGKDNYDVDREVGDRTKALMPEVVMLARQSRAYLIRAVQFLAGQAGIDQFLDIGTGLPTADNTHEVAQRVNPAARILYVDNDPLVLAHARALLTSTPQGECHYIDADLRDPDRILTQAEGFLDFGRPVGLMLMGILEFIPDQAEAVAIVDALRERLAPGSYIALYATTNHVNGARVDRAVALWNQQAPAPMTVRTIGQIEELLRGLRLVDPGLVPLHLWRPTHPLMIGEPVDAYAGVGIKPEHD